MDRYLETVILAFANVGAPPLPVQGVIGRAWAGHLEASLLPPGSAPCASAAATRAISHHHLQLGSGRGG